MPGDNWEEVLEEHLNTADLIFLLISPDFMYSDYCHNKEMARALERHAKGEAKVIPVIVRRVDFENAPFSHIQVLPTDARPIKSWPDPDEAFYDVVVGVKCAIQQLLSMPQTVEASSPAPHPEEASTSAQKLSPQSKSASSKTKEQWIQEGYALWKLKRFEGALVAYEQALLLDPNSADAYHGKGATLHELNHFEEALAAYEQALLLDPNDAYVHYDKGITLRHLYREEEADQAQEKAIELGYL